MKSLEPPEKKSYFHENFVPLLGIISPKPFPIRDKFPRQKAISLSILANKGSEFKLDCVEFNNSYILLINVINFKIRLINFVYTF